MAVSIASRKNSSAWAILIASCLTLLLYFVPALHFAAYPFLLLSTLVHEMGHGITAMLLGGHFHSFQMWSDGSGVAQYSGRFGALANAAVAAGGLLGPSITAAIFFNALRAPRHAQICLALFASLCIVAIVLVVRNVFGIIFVAIVASLCIVFAFSKAKQYAQIALAFLATQLALSVFSRMDYLFTPIAHTSAGAMPSDVSQIARALWLPYWFWGALLAVFSVLVLVFGLRQVLKR